MPPRRPLPLHPLLFAAVPALALWLRTLSDGVGLGDVVAPLLVTVGAAAAVTAAAALLLQRDVRRGALVASAAVVLVFAFGPLASALGPHVARGVLLAAFGAVLVAVVVAVARAGRPRTVGWTRALNVIAAGLVLVNIASIGWYRVKNHVHGADASAILAAAHGRAAVGKPDVFYIVLDDYGGEAAMRDLLGYDNRPFLDALRRRGFGVPEHATTNYPRTSFMLASTLNLQYLDALVPHGTVLTENVLRPLIADDTVPKLFKEHGYRYVHVGSWVRDTATNPQADVNVTLGHGLSDFSNALLQQTALQPALESFGSFDWDRQQYERALFQFDQTAKARALPGPTFVFTHILVPHWPYVFDANGRFDDARLSVAAIKRPLAQVSGAIRERYIRQLQFVNQRTLALIDSLLSGPASSRPVIVLQSDEGFFTWLETGAELPDRDLEQHFDTLNAYFFPRLRSTGLYPTITPVNTFRLLFDDYFGARLPLLPDRNLALEGQQGGYRFQDVTSRVRALV